MKKAIEPVPLPASPGFYGRLFVVPKPDGSWRPILDVSALNVFVQQTSFKMESTASVLASVQSGDWMTAIDLSDAYFHVPMHPGSRHYLRFCVGGRAFQFKVLPFGLSTAPQVFTRIVTQLGKFLHLMNVRIHLYLDDWLILAYTQDQSFSCTALTCSTATELGILINVKKSKLVPSRQMEYLGVQIDTLRF